MSNENYYPMELAKAITILNQINPEEAVKASEQYKELMGSHSKVVQLEDWNRKLGKRVLESSDENVELMNKIDQLNMINDYTHRGISKYPECSYVIIDIEKWVVDYKSEVEYKQIKEDSELWRAYKLASLKGYKIDELVDCGSDETIVWIVIIHEWGKSSSESYDKPLIDWYREQIQKGDNQC